LTAAKSNPALLHVATGNDSRYIGRVPIDPRVT
jgi:hypothetical protein